MKKLDREFRPGFRISTMDIFILLTGIIGGVLLSLQTPWAGFVPIFVVLHFFLFCNVFRLSRPPELIWAGAFVVLAGSTILTGIPGWLATVLCSIALSSYLIWQETRKPHYHGVCWQRWNPGLIEWWNQNSAPANNA